MSNSRIRYTAIFAYSEIWNIVPVLKLLMQEAQDVLHAKGWVTALPFPFLFSLSYDVHCHSQETTAAPHPPTKYSQNRDKVLRPEPVSC